MPTASSSASRRRACVDAVFAGLVAEIEMLLRADSPGAVPELADWCDTPGFHSRVAMTQWRIAPALPRSLDDVPTSASALTAEWLTPALCRDVPGATVVEFEVLGGSAGTAVGTGCSSATTPPDIGPACQRGCS